ncbi:hypothetical protein BD309DRAFT_1022213 [Dichomitus squalens]|uniref:Uncharacterized protein n=1 Tax=Dichomitus squalens TaxID=114155 RepID=A0A4Q9PC62_9APHY|nr:hypothetical protein BD309DRAFT_1022213 [Dichomitus squalens]TBU51615.1 hypothetical protein BD310DRAFT_982467 [Dichomitus squalens]
MTMEKQALVAQFRRGSNMKPSNVPGQNNIPPDQLGPASIKPLMNLRTVWWNGPPNDHHSVGFADTKCVDAANLGSLFIPSENLSSRRLPPATNPAEALDPSAFNVDFPFGDLDVTGGLMGDWSLNFERDFAA